MNNPCCCEHASHPLTKRGRGLRNKYFPEYIMDGHIYCAVPAGNSIASWVGPVCDYCAANCMSEYLV